MHESPQQIYADAKTSDKQRLVGHCLLNFTMQAACLL